MNAEALIRRRGWSALWPLIAIWAFLRTLASFWVAFLSPLRPLTPIEQAQPLWPPGESVAVWLERVLLAPWLRWDVHYYVSIVQDGYRPGDGTAQFHPLLPWLARPLYALTGHPLLALWLVSSAAALGTIIAFDRLAALDLPESGNRKSLLLLLFFPIAFILFAPYTESLFLLCSMLCLFWARNRSWWLAGLAGALATLTRQQGLFLILPIAWELWESTGRRPRRLISRWPQCLSLGLIPGGLLIWILYRAMALSDLRPDWSGLDGLLYSVVISPDSARVVPHQAFLWPWDSLERALAVVWRTGEIRVLIDLLGAGLFVGLFILAWPALRTSYRLYSGAILLASFSYYTGPYYPYMGLPRHLFLAFPVFIGLGSVLRKGWQWILVCCVGISGWLFLALLYVIEGWTP